MTTILAIDDNIEVLGTISRALKRENHTVIQAISAAQARSRIKETFPDLIILDIMMPQQDGLSFCRELRENTELSLVPILFLSARMQTESIIEGLDAGADDYLTKPFDLKELNARVRALLRRSSRYSDPPDTLVVGEMKLTPKTFQIQIGENSPIQLTSTEYRLLYHLMEHPNDVHSVHELLDSVWQYPAGTGDPDLVRAHIRNLRAKIEPNSRKPIYIHTIHGVGYMVKA